MTRTPEQIIGKDALTQLIFEGYHVALSLPVSNTGENAEHVKQLLDGLDKIQEQINKYDDLLAAADARIAELEADVAGLNEDTIRLLKDKMDNWERAFTAEASLGEARRALEPFAKHCDAELNDWCPDDVAAFYFSQDGFDEPSSVTVGDFRRARATLDRIGK